MVEIGTHSVIERADVVTLDLTVRAPQFYPNRSNELTTVVDSGWSGEHWSKYRVPGHRPGRQDISLWDL